MCLEVILISALQVVRELVALSKIEENFRFTAFDVRLLSDLIRFSQ